MALASDLAQLIRAFFLLEMGEYIARSLEAKR
jgi:hypothetical protein